VTSPAELLAELRPAEPTVRSLAGRLWRLVWRHAYRYDQCVRAIMVLEIALYGRVLSTSIQRECDPHEWSTWSRRFAVPLPDGRRGEWYTCCSRCRLEARER
jgi:hypothetical protein